MMQCSSQDGFPTDWHLVHLGSRAVGGAGLVCVEGTAVSSEGRLNDYDLGLWKDDFIEPLQRITRFLKAHGSVPGIQLHHAGRKGGLTLPWEGKDPANSPDGTVLDASWALVAPTDKPFPKRQMNVRKVTITDIQRIQNDFLQSVRRAHEAGFGVVELHAAHGYLMNQFLSTASNEMPEPYGGSFDNRARFLLEIVRGARRILPDDKVLAVRISVHDWGEGGWSVEESVELVRRMKQEGVDLVDISSGTVLPRPYEYCPGVHVPYAERVRREAGLPTAVVGWIREPEQANEIIERGQADVVMIGKAMLLDPYWPVNAARKLGCPERLTLPIQYEFWFSTKAQRGPTPHRDITAPETLVKKAG
jgi:2,4-dienoyl-CoA reductase-like NADH-dependent reductase (Old Yellow Enzyme family)